MSYQSKHTGTNIDNAVSAHTQLDNEIASLKSKDTTLQNNINTVSNNVATNATNINSLNNSVSSLNNTTSGLNNTINSLKKSYYCCVYYQGSGDTSFSGIVKFNTILYNEGNCYSSSTGLYTVPETGYYMATFTYFTNSTASNQRPAIMCSGYPNAMTNSEGVAVGHSIVTTRYLTKGQTICAGAYSSNFPINFYAGSGHNEFTVIKIK